MQRKRNREYLGGEMLAEGDSICFTLTTGFLKSQIL